MKTLSSLINDVEIQRVFWLDISNDEDALRVRGKTKEELLLLVKYFEGKYDGLCDALRLDTDGQTEL